MGGVPAVRAGGPAHGSADIRLDGVPKPRIERPIDAVVRLTASAKVMGAGRVIAVDRLPGRLAMVEKLGAETVNFDEVNPAERIVEMTGGDGADKVIDAVGVDAQHAHSGPAGPSIMARSRKR